MKINSMMLFLASANFVLATYCLAEWNEYSPGEPLLPERLPKGSYGTDKFLTRMDDGSMLCLYTNLGLKRDRYSILRLKRPDGIVVEFRIDNDVIPKDKNGIKEWLSQNPALFKDRTVNIIPSGDNLFLFCRYKGNVVQMLNMDLKVEKVVYDDTSWAPVGNSYINHHPFPRPMTILDNGNILTCAERGELAEYSTDGAVVKRYVIPGLFNESRIEKPKAVGKDMYNTYPEHIAQTMRNQDMEHYASDARFATEFLVKRDAVVPPPTKLKGDVMPTRVDALATAADGRVILLGADRLFEIDLPSLAVRPLEIPGFELSPDQWGRKETISGIRVKGPFLYIATSRRMIASVLAPGVIGEMPLDRSNQPEAPWDIAPPESVGTMLIPSLNKRMVEELPIPPVKK